MEEQQSYGVGHALLPPHGLRRVFRRLRPTGCAPCAVPRHGQQLQRWQRWHGGGGCFALFLAVKAAGGGGVREKTVTKYVRLRYIVGTTDGASTLPYDI